MSIYIFLAFALLLTFLIGRLLEKLRVPWIFSALLIGFLLAIYNPFPVATSSETFEFLAQLGMYSLLFMIGFELDLIELKKLGKFIIKSTLIIICLEAFFGTLLVHFVFGYNWFVSFLVAMSFATVGEAILLPILDEFNIVNTKLGQSIIGIGTFDDIFEIMVLMLVIFLLGFQENPDVNIVIVLASLLILLLLTYGLRWLKKRSQKFAFLKIENLFLFVLFILFLFIGIGEFAHASAIAALIAGLGVKTFIPTERLQLIESEVKTMCYGFFSPLFFIWVGLTMNITYIATYPLLILLVVFVSKGAKLLGSYIATKKELGTKQSILLGIALSVRFSTSIIIIKILFENGFVGSDLYSVIVASSMVFKFIIPLLFANLLVRWKVVVDYKK